MRVVSKLQEDFAFCMDSLESIISKRIIATQKNSEFNITRFKTQAFEYSLDKILRLPNTVAFEKKLVLLLAIVPCLKPGFLEDIISGTLPQGGEIAGFGVIKGQNGLLPTVETALFMLAGNNAAKRQKYKKMFGKKTAFGIPPLLQINQDPNGEPEMSGQLIPDPAWLEKIFLDLEVSPVKSNEFRAGKISTSLRWEDLVLHPQTRKQIRDIEKWVSQYQTEGDSTVRREKKPGYKVLFYGKEGTGKTLTATLIGKKFNLPVYRIDLSLVESKYIGETEKNLNKIFCRAEKENAILFFDEADALFGKRTNVRDSHDKYANVEVSYLLQEIEHFKGLLILAFNSKGNLDDAFIRRFNNVVPFPLPGPAERLKLWVNNVPEQLIAKDIGWNAIAEKFEISGAEIVNVMNDAALKAYSRKGDNLLPEDIYEGIKKKLKKRE